LSLIANVQLDGKQLPLTKLGVDLLLVVSQPVKLPLELVLKSLLVSLMV